MPILRCLEPGFIEALRKNLTWSTEDDRKRNIESQETSLAFLASKLNVELVNSILKGITRFALVDLDQAVSAGNYMRLTLKDANFIYNTKADYSKEGIQYDHGNKCSFRADINNPHVYQSYRDKLI